MKKEIRGLTDTEVKALKDLILQKGIAECRDIIISKIRENITDRNDLIRKGVLTANEIDKFIYLNPSEVNELNELISRKGLNACRDAIINAINECITDRNDLIAKGILTDYDFDKEILTEEDHYNGIRNQHYIFEELKRTLIHGYLEFCDPCEYSIDRIRSLAKNGIIIKKDLVTRGIISEDIADLLIDGSMSPYKTDEIFPEEIPPLVKGRTDVFVFGTVGSGKSCLMAGLFFYFKKIGKVTFDPSINKNGRDYADVLFHSVEEGRLIRANAENDFQYMNMDVKDEKNKQHKFTFFEMAGEMFNKIYDTRGELDKANPKLTEYIVNNSNNKIIFLTIDYNYGKNISRQAEKFEETLRILDNKGTLNSTLAIVIIITKWDLYKEGDKTNNARIFIEENYKGTNVYADAIRAIEDNDRNRINRYAAKKFINDKFKNLDGMCEDLKIKYQENNKNFRYYVYNFSLGFFNNSNTLYEYREEDSCKIYELITSGSDDETKRSWLNIFNK